jgi:hypothetical protein
MALKKFVAASPNKSLQFFLNSALPVLVSSAWRFCDIHWHDIESTRISFLANLDQSEIAKKG